MNRHIDVGWLAVCYSLLHRLNLSVNARLTFI